MNSLEAMLESIQAELVEIKSRIGVLASGTRLPVEGFARIKQILGDPKANPPIPAIIPISPSSWWDGVSKKIYPAPIRHGRVTLWRVEDIRALIARINAEPAVPSPTSPLVRPIAKINRPKPRSRRSSRQNGDRVSATTKEIARDD